MGGQRCRPRAVWRVLSRGAPSSTLSRLESILYGMRKTNDRLRKSEFNEHLFPLTGSDAALLRCADSLSVPRQYALPGER